MQKTTLPHHDVSKEFYNFPYHKLDKWKNRTPFAHQPLTEFLASHNPTEIPERAKTFDVVTRDKKDNDEEAC